MNILAPHPVKLLNIPSFIRSQTSANRPIFVNMAGDAAYMSRCLELAERGLGNTAPNPLVGAVLVFEDRIIGEGYHAFHGGPHAEVNCIASVKEQDRPLISRSKLFVSLEPCAHHGKTPPCTDLILHHKIPEVVIAMKDPFAAVNGKGIQILSEAGILVRIGLLEKEARFLNRRFIAFQKKKRPYVVLKWAQTANHKLAGKHPQRLRISGPVSDRLIHRWRSEESAIMIGKNTALKDDPLLTNRYWSGPSPLRIVMDSHLQLPGHLQVFRDHPTWILNEKKEGTEGSNTYIQYPVSGKRLNEILQLLGERKLMSILVEGGPTLLKSFLQEDCWDEIRTITNTAMTVASDCHAPELPDILPATTLNLGNDTIQWYYREQ